jgi:hypothetical protein
MAVLVTVAIELSGSERRELPSLTPAEKTWQDMARRARIILTATAGLTAHRGSTSQLARSTAAAIRTRASWINQIE